MKVCVWLVAIVAVALAGSRIFAQQPAAAPPIIRSDISGDWSVISNEDAMHRGPGPELGDYTGLPLNDAGRQKADSWDASSLSEPERQAQPHPIQYLMRGPGPALRISRVLDPVTQEVTAYTIAGGFGRADRIIWMDGRPHPSDYSEHTWDGFSTGAWVNGQLVVTTTHMKQGVVQRNGSPTSPYGKMVEHFFRHGEYMQMAWTIDDPIYFEEPMVRSHTWRLNPNGNMTFGNAFESVEEVAMPPGWVPAWPLGTKHTEFAETRGLPFAATRGGKESLYPEYQLKLQQMMKDGSK